MRFKPSVKKITTFARVIRAYGWKEKLLSLFLIVLIAYLGVDWLRTGTFFSNQAAQTVSTGRYSEGLVGQIRLLNPLFVDLNPADRTITQLIFQGLTRYDPQNGEIVDNIARSFVSPDHKTYSFRLNDGMKWHDGQPVTVDDLYFTFHDVILSPDFANPILKANFEGVEIRRVDPMKIEFTLKAPNSFFPANLTVGILPQHILKDVPVKDLAANEFNFKPIGNGPYKMGEPYQKYPDGRMEALLTVFDDYVGAKPAIREVRFVTYPTYDGLVAGRSALNAIEKVPGDVLDAFKDDTRFSLLSFELPQYTALFINMDSLQMKKLKVRLALQKSLDKQALLKELGSKQAVDTPLMQLEQEDWLYQVNIEEAKGALYDSKYRFANEGDKFRKTLEDEDFSVILLARDFTENNAKAQETRKTVDFIKKSWEAIGVEVDARLLPEGEYNAAISARNYDVVLAGQSLGYNLDTYSYWHSTQASSGLNLSNYQSFAADKTIEAIRETFDKEGEAKYLKTLAQMIADDVPAIFLYRPMYYYVTDNRVQGMSFENLVFPGDKFVSINEWKVKR